jgi:NAD(P)-dependent dehydrogenase (short-subunit alcohol dehydrogenase family)
MTFFGCFQKKTLSQKNKALKASSKTVIVTAGAKGIGKATSLAFAKKGYNVVIAVRNLNQAKEVLKEIESIGGSAVAIKADVTIEKDIIRAVDETVKKYGKLDAFVNNAGVVGSTKELLGDATTENFEALLQTNVMGTFWGMKYAIKAMLKTGGGSIVNVSSIAGESGLPALAQYCASKHAILGLTKAAAVEYASQGIRVNAVTPGPIKTDMMKETIAQGGVTEEDFRNMIPALRVGTVDDVANAIYFLGSDESPYMTGSILPVDGGYSAK